MPDHQALLLTTGPRAPRGCARPIDEIVISGRVGPFRQLVNVVDQRHEWFPARDEL